MRRLSILAALAAAGIAAHAQASEYLSGSLGWFDVNKQRDEALEFGLQYRFNPMQYGLRPMVGAMVTTESSLYGYGGVAWELQLIESRLYLTPSFAAGLYSEGDGKDLGGALEFRSGIMLEYQMPDASRFGIELNHLSNASIYRDNPGVETLLVNYSVPVNLFGR